MSGYMTKQRKELLLFLSEHPDEVFSAKQIAGLLSEENISVSAVYRNLAALEHSGSVRRVSRPGAREALYRYTGAEACRECLHLSCKNCGRTFHMDADDADVLVHRLARNEQFSVDRSATVLYGVCRYCRNGEDERKT